MKVILEIDDETGCLHCPYCRYDDDFENDSDCGFYCVKEKKKRYIAYIYNMNHDRGIKIPSWCGLKKFDDKILTEEELEDFAEELSDNWATKGLVTEEGYEEVRYHTIEEQKAYKEGVKKCYNKIKE